MIGGLDALRPISLADVLATADLQDRVDRKYLVGRRTADALLPQLSRHVAALEIEGRRLNGYSTVYFDSPDLACHRAHLQGRRLRWKARTRRYVDSDLCRLELKTKGPRGRTVKKITDIPAGRHGRIDPAGREFLDAALRAAYGVGLDLQLRPVLAVVYRRATLVGGGERLTLDFDLEVRRPGGAPVGLLVRDAVLIESKAGPAPGVADRALRSLGARETALSKYCAGTALSRPDIPAPDLRPVLRRWFCSNA